MLPTATYVICILTLVFFAPSDFTQLECNQSSPSSMPFFLRDVNVPPVDPSKYIADPDRKPFHVLFILLSPVSTEMSQVLADATRKVNQRLAGILKTPRLQEVRAARSWNPTYGRCNPPTCTWDSAIIPGEYVMPCKSPDGELILEPNVRCAASRKVKELNEKRMVSLVIYMDAEGSNREHVNHCAEEKVDGYSNMCQLDTNTRRPTHGYIGVCAGASELHGDKAERLILHETLHMLTHSNVVGMGSPKLGCPFDGNHVRSLVGCEGKTYKAVQQLWRKQDGTVFNRTRLLTITPNVVEVARRHFGCPTLEGAEIKGKEVTKEESEELNGTVQEGKLIPEGHWSRTLFPDEILMPNDCGHMRLSALTLGLLRDFDWYDVDMDAAEEMVATKPEPGQGCRIAENYYSEVIAASRVIQAVNNQDKPNAVVSGNIGPYCDNDYGNKDRVVTSMCYNDREPQICFTVTDPWSAVLSRPNYYDSFVCDQSRIVTRLYPPALGATVGPGTTCLTVEPFPVADVHTKAIGICVEYHCEGDRKEVELIWKPLGKNCTIICPEHASRKLWTISFANNEDCTEALSENITVICPNYAAVCQSKEQKDQHLDDQIASADKNDAVIVTLEWIGVGSVLAATALTMAVGV